MNTAIPKPLTSFPLPSFDGTVICQSQVARPDRYRALEELVRSTNKIIIRGSGLSYCSASAHPNSCSVLLSQFNRILEFDRSTGAVIVECGISLGSLLTFALQKGFYVPVLPGHPCITVGGALGFDVHGKSQTHFGNFKRCVECFWLFHPDHGEIECSPTKNSALFDLTIGGFGLTGVILKAQLKLTPLKGNAILIEKIPSKNILDAAQIMHDQKDNYDNLYSWNNLNLRGEDFGAGFVYAEKFIFSEKSAKDIRDFNPLSSIAVERRSITAWNSITIPWMCRIYGLKETLSAKERILGLKQGSFPINGKEIYFNLFGKRGFREYQLIVDTQQWPKLVQDVRALIKAHKISASLGSLKLFHGDTKFLTFCKTGVCLSLDVAADARSLPFFAALDGVVVERGGIVNIAKDSRLTAKTVKQLFPEYALFKKAILEFDPKLLFWSELRERMELF